MIPATRRGWQQLGRTRYGLFALTSVCQLATIWITWPLWQARHDPPNLPLLESFPELSFGWPIVISLLFGFARPRQGVVLHWCVLVVACLFDQFRLHPQFFGLAMLMTACVGDAGLRVCRWHLAATWLWAGLHKLLSPDWFGHTSWSLVSQSGVDPESTYLWFATIVATSELALGGLACFRPAWAARLCVPIHLGIVVFLSPLFSGINNSVIPWNIATAVVGFYVMRNAAMMSTRPRWELAVGLVMLTVPIGFYGGWVDRCFAAVLYSDCLPRGLVTQRDGLQRVHGWHELEVPFPSERRLYKQFFQSVAQPGDKLHVSDPRSWLDDQYFVIDPGGTPREIDVEEFFRVGPRAVAGVGLDRKRSLFALSRAGVRMLRESDDSMVYALEFTPETFNASLLPNLEGLPNLRQIQFAGTDIQDSDLIMLTELRLLTGIGLDNTQVTDKGLQQLRGLPYLRHIEHANTAITEEGLAAFR